ncbi:MAG: NHL repeat-containing protein [Firmicutes bacterium]|nr:NHL repeat-containing protein [Bacillota bacterium]
MKKLVILLLVFILVMAPAAPVFADTPYQGFSYNFWAGMTPAPVAYVPLRSFVLQDICPDLGEMTEATSLHVDPENNIFLIDSGNHRIIVFDEDLNLVDEMRGFYRNGQWSSFNRPTGVFVTHEMQLYISDTHNHRIVVLDRDRNFVREILAPEIGGREEDFVFLPLHIVVDRGGRTFVIVQREFEGIMQFNAEGEFIGYFGTINVGFNPIDMFWRMFMTQEQRSRQRLFIPTEFQGMDIDDYGFIFTTNIERWARANQVMRLNPRGENVIRNLNDNVRLSGSQNFRGGGTLAGPSVLIDVAAMSHGMFVTLDSTRGRIYTYDQEGNMLHAIAGTGAMQGMARRPISIVILNDDYLVLDAHGRGRITQFTPTEYGALINAAVRARYDGDEAAAVAAWRRLVELDENFALAWSGIGRTMLASGDNVQAMYYLRRGMDVRYYSVAFRRHRLDTMQNVLPTVLTIAVFIPVIVIIAKIVLRFRKKGAAAT